MVTDFKYQDKYLERIIYTINKNVIKLNIYKNLE